MNAESEVEKANGGVPRAVDDHAITTPDDEKNADRLLGDARIGIPERSSSPPAVVHNGIAAPIPPPNGGLKAWMQVAGAFCLYFNTWGE